VVVVAFNALLLLYAFVEYRRSPLDEHDLRE